MSCSRKFLQLCAPLLQFACGMLMYSGFQLGKGFFRWSCSLHGVQDRPRHPCQCLQGSGPRSGGVSSDGCRPAASPWQKQDNQDCRRHNLIVPACNRTRLHVRITRTSTEMSWKHHYSLLHVSPFENGRSRAKTWRQQSKAYLPPPCPGVDQVTGMIVLWVSDRLWSHKRIAGLVCAAAACTTRFARPSSSVVVINERPLPFAPPHLPPFAPHLYLLRCYCMGFVCAV